MGDTPNVWSLNEDVTIDIMVVDPSTALGLTGKSAVIDISIRNSSGLYFQGGSWGAGFITLNPVEADAVNEPGRYYYTIPGASNIVEDQYYVYVSISDPPTIEAQTAELHVVRDTDISLYEMEPA